MPICCVCQADGVAEVLGGWYCVDHLEVALIDLAKFCAPHWGWDVDETEASIEYWINPDEQSMP